MTGEGGRQLGSNVRRAARQTRRSTQHMRGLAPCPVPPPLSPGHLLHIALQPPCPTSLGARVPLRRSYAGYYQGERQLPTSFKILANIKTKYGAKGDGR